MSDDQQPQSPIRSGRRSSFAGQTFADLFGTGRSSASRPSNENSQPANNQQAPGPITQAAARAQGRRLSVTTLGLSGSPNQSSPFDTFRNRQGSISSGSTDESAIAEDDGPAREPNPTPASPFARRTSFGARALRDIRTSSFGSGGGSAGNGSPPGQNGTRSPHATSSTSNGTATRKPSSAHNGTISARGGTNEGFNWSDNFRTRAERTSSIVGQGGGGGGPPALERPNHSRAKSVAVMEPPPAAQMPKPKEQKRPDHFQERILKGDFYMD
ncbi:hypothetical protein LTR37_006961 [Vermiconidia calcicola]|uniref:Uncharacterized protein n=1 Tax=Vermiconidia calcicola TaxID=1690605 RepID=A0ACC3NGB4_9PEZI|nr:hypothetical protein LTR37_006961 [Vermiconidia calcicola]